MEDDNGLELSLSLTCCQLASKSKDIGDNSLDMRTEEGDRSSRLIDDFKHFLEGGTGKLESVTGSQRSEPSKPEERGLWISNDNKRPEVEEEKGPESINRRKFIFEEMNNQKKYGRESHNSDLQERSRQSHISLNTDDGSTAENEDVADSEVIGSTSRMVSRHENNGKKYIRGAAPCEAGNEVYSVFDTSAVDVSGQRAFTITPEKEFGAGKVPYNVTFPTQPVNILNMPHSISAKEHGGGPSVMPGNVSSMFGYSSVQLPILDKDNSRGLVSHPQQLHASYAGRFPSTTDKLNDGPSKISQVVQKPSEAPQYIGSALECNRSEGKQHVGDSGSKDESNKLPSELSSITPGIASDIKFGGCGSFPNLPWVSTKGPGPNGRTISGVTYRFSETQIKIVCACHGFHMFPEEFVWHASEEKSGPAA